MGAGVAVLIFIVILGAVLVFMAISIYNNLIRLKKQVERAWANIDVILQQRFEEVTSLVKVVEQFTQYEKSVIDGLVNARAKYGSAQNVGDKIDASNDMTLALKGIFAIGENYPEIKSSENFQQLQSRISALEESLADRRELYNETTTNFNTRIRQIPDVFFAGMFGYKDEPLYKVDEAFKVRPNLDMNLPS